MDLNNMQTWQYFAFAGGGLLVIAVVLYFIPAGKLRLPGVVTAGFGGTALGLALGVLLMASFGYKPSREESPPDAEAARPKMGAGGGAIPKAGGFGGGMPKAGTGGPGGGGPRSSKAQLAELVTALDQVADRPVTITLSPAQRRTIAAQLAGLDAAADLSEEEARAKVQAIHQIVETDYEALAAVGYRALIPGKGNAGGGPGMAKGPPKEPPPNPFKEGPAAQHLKSLLDRLMAKK
jgi:hypothetical protein